MLELNLVVTSCKTLPFPNPQYTERKLNGLLRSNEKNDVGCGDVFSRRTTTITTELAAMIKIKIVLLYKRLGYLRLRSKDVCSSCTAFSSGNLSLLMEHEILWK